MRSHGRVLVTSFALGGCARGPGPAVPYAAAPSAPAVLVPQIGHESAVYGVEFSPEGDNRLLTWSLDGTGILWDVASGRWLRGLNLRKGGITEGTWFPDARRIALVSPDYATVFDAQSGAPLLELTGPEVGGNVAVSPDGRWLATTFAVWDASTGKLRANLAHTFDESQELSFSPDELQELSFSPDGRQIAARPYGGTALVLDAANGRVRYPVDGHAYDLLELAWSPDGRTLATRGHDGRLILRDADRGNVTWTLTSLQMGMRSTSRSIRREADWSSKETRVSHGSLMPRRDLCSARSRSWKSTTATSARWPSPRMEPFSPLRGDETSRASGMSKPENLAQICAWRGRAPSGLNYAPDGHRLAVGHGWSEGGGATVFDAQTGAVLQRLTSQTAPILDAVAVGTDQLVTLTGEPAVVTWDLRAGRLIARTELTEPKENYSRFLLSPHGDRVAVWRNDAFSLWDVQSGVRVASFDGAHYGSNLFFRRTVRGCSRPWSRGEVELRDAVTADRRVSLVGHAETVLSATFSSDGARVLTGSDESVARLWDVPTGTLLHELPAPGGTQSVGFSDDGTTAIVSSPDGSMILWDVTTGSEQFRVDGFVRTVDEVLVTADRRWVIAATMAFVRPFGRLHIYMLEAPV